MTNGARVPVEARYHESQGGIAMKLRALRWSALVLACLLASGCKDREPIKPIAASPLAIFIDY
jgi:hypothetical protein